MLESHEYELHKLQKHDKVLKLIRNILNSIVLPMMILLVLDIFGIIDLPFFESTSTLSMSAFIALWFGIPIRLMEKRLKKIEKRINEINSLYNGDSKYF